MCLGVPGRVVRWIEPQGPFASAEVEFGGVTRVCNLACVPDVQVGDYVIIHAGIAINRLDADEAHKLLQELRALETLADDAAIPPDGAG